MTVQQYFAAIRSLGLRPTNVPNVYEDSSGDKRNVRDPADLTEVQRAEFIAKLKFHMGVGPSPY